MPSSLELDQEIARLRVQLKNLANEAKQAGCLQDGHDHMDRAPPAAAATQLDPAYQPQVSTGLSHVCAWASGQHVCCLSGCLCQVAPGSLLFRADVLSSVQKRTVCPPACLPAVPLRVPHSLQSYFVVVHRSMTINALSAPGCAFARCPHSAYPSRQMCAATTGSHSYRPPALMSS